MIIAIDCDGVILDWFSAFKEFMDRKGIIAKLPFEDYAMSTSYPGLDIMYYIEEFNQSPEFGNLSYLPNALESVRAIKNLGHSIVAITAPGNSITTKNLRLKNIAEFNFDHVEVLPLITKKIDVMNKLKVDLIIDDSVKVIKEAGEKAILFEDFHNINFEHDKRMKDWNCWTKYIF